jgi:hypothetical protein
MSLSPNDNPLADNASDMKDQNFGGRREFTTGVQQREQDYKKPTGGSVNVKKNPVDETIRDIDDMTDAKARKREFSRRAETADHSDHNKERFHETEPDNRPPEGTDETQVPDDKHKRSKLKNHFGSGQYDNNPNRGTYEGEIS